MAYLLVECGNWSKCLPFSAGNGQECYRLLGTTTISLRFLPVDSAGRESLSHVDTHWGKC